MVKVFHLGNILIALCLFAAVAAAVLFLHFPAETGLFAASGNTALPVLLIDPGHGGEDGGAVSVTGTYESIINFDIALRVADLAGLTGIPYKLTRESADISYPKELKSVAKRKAYDQRARVALINGTPDAVLVSIHQNFFPKKSVYGPQVFYAKTTRSDVLAGYFRETLDEALLPENERAAKPIAENIYLMKNVRCPAVLVECGFLSNAKEAARLDTQEYRLRIAAALTGAYLRYLGSEGTNES